MSIRVTANRITEEAYQEKVRELIVVLKACAEIVNDFEGEDKAIYEEYLARQERTRKVENELFVGEGNSQLTGTEAGGTIFANVSNAGNMYNHDKYASPRGHGFAAEDANHLYDRLHGRDARLVGGDNVKHGADRIVDGVEIQTKFCKTGGECISECFQDGNMKYINSDGKPMQIEVPFDKYDSAIQAMENRIKNGQVPGVTDPSEAKNIVRQSPYTYEQVRNIAKAGNIDSIKFDATNGAIISLSAFSISAMITFATSIWNGDSLDVALKKSAYSGLKVGGITFVSSVLASQLSKAGLNSALVGSSEAIVNIMGPKVSAMIVNALRSGQNIYGSAAMKSAAKLLRGNMITGAITTVILSSGDVINIFRGRISGKQLFKNLANTAATVAGGTAGWAGGAAIGASVGSMVPGIGTAIGGFIGGVAGAIGGGTAVGKATNAVTGAFIEDDADEMVRIIEGEFASLASDYLVNQKEAEKIADNLQAVLTGSTLKDMFASGNKSDFANELLKPEIEKVVKQRPVIKTPTIGKMTEGLRMALEEINESVEE